MERYNKGGRHLATTLNHNLKQVHDSDECIGIIRHQLNSLPQTQNSKIKIGAFLRDSLTGQGVHSPRIGSLFRGQSPSIQQTHLDG
jgi:hypothetical protein